MRVLWKPVAAAACWLAFAAGASTPGPAPDPGFVDPIDEPAQASPLAAHTTVLALAHAGKRLVAAGARGHVLWSEDEGRSWQQAKVPVSIDLVGLSFPTPAQGWAVGHGGVVLHTADGGKTWERQLAGLDAARLALKAYEAQPPKDPKLVAGVKDQLAVPRGEPFLDVYFWNERSGFVIGTFGAIYRTDDGGKTWSPWMDRLPNPGGLNLFAVSGRGDRVFVVGEQGMVWRLDPAAQSFMPAGTGYAGTLFGLHASARGPLLVFGMRGSLFRSQDDGATWAEVRLDTRAGLTAATETGDGRIIVVDQAGNLLSSADGGASFTRTAAQPPAPLFAVTAEGERHVVVGGPIGLMQQALR